MTQGGEHAIVVNGRERMMREGVIMDEGDEESDAMRLDKYM